MGTLSAQQTSMMSPHWIELTTNRSYAVTIKLAATYSLESNLPKNQYQTNNNMMIQHRTVHRGIFASPRSGAIYLFLALIVGLALTPQRLLSQTRQTSAEKGTITLTTAKAIGETILLAIDGEGDITIDGVEEAPQMGQFPSRRYTLTQQTVTICGDVTFLRANSVKLTSIILDKCDKLTELYCLGNELTALDLAGSPNLQTLWCNNNKLTSLDVSKSPKLEGLWCYNNLITDLNLSNSHNLSMLQCYWNSLETLDLSKCTKLQHLECHHNKLSILDLSSCVEIEKILCDNNQLTSITLLAENPKLKVVTCHDNKLQKLVIGHAPSLEGIYCYNNQITEIGFHDTPLLMTVIFHNNQIKGEKMTQLVQRLPDRTNEYFPGTFIVHATPETRPQEGNVCFKSDVALAQPKNWQAYYYGEGYDYIPYEGEDNTSSTPTITMTTTASVGNTIKLSVDAEGEPEVEGAELKFGGEAIVKAPQITIRGHVTGIDCSDAQLTELNVSQMPTLTKLWCNNNALTALDTRTLADLEIFQCIGNQLTELDITANKKLLELDCSENKLTQIDLSSCEKLTLFLAYHNAIGQIDLSHNAELIGIDLSENQLSALSVAANPKLETIYCNGNAIKDGAMKQFISSLPDRTDREKMCNLFVIDTKNTKEENVIFKKQVQEALSKHWKVLNYSAGDEDGAGIPYEGTEEPISHPESIVLKTTSEEVSLTIGAPSGQVYVNWGDGEWSQATVSEYGAIVKGTRRGDQVVISGADITRFKCPNSDITELFLNEVPELQVLHCYSNALSRIDLSKTPQLKELYLQDNQLRQVDLTMLSHLSDLNASNNELSTISLEGNKELVSLSLLGNKLSSVDLSTCPNLEDVSLGYNQLSALDIRSNPKLYWIIIYKNNFSQEAVKSLFESLPTRPDKDGQIKILESRDDEVPEGNKFNSADIVIATQKGWRVMDGTGEIPSGLSKLSREGEAVQLYKSESGLTVMAPFPCLIYSIEGVCLGQTKVPEDQLTRDEYPSVLLLNTPQGAVHKLLL